MSADSQRRFLRPRSVFFSSGYVWVLDETQPVAALFDPYTERFARLVSWTDLPPPPQGAGHPQIQADADGVWVQNHRDGPLVRVGIDGIVHAEYTQGHRLICAGSAGAWCFSSVRRRRDIAPAPDTPPIRSLRPPMLLVALPEGGARRVGIDGVAVVSVEFDESSLFVGVEHDPWERVPTSARTRVERAGFEVRYSSSVLQVPLDGPIPERIGPDTHPCRQDREVEHTSEYSDTSYNEAHRRKRALDAALRWHWGTDLAQPGTTIVRAYRPDTSALATEIKFSGMRVTDGAAAAGRLWIVTTPEIRTGSGRAVFTIGADGELRPLRVEGIDITGRCRPLGPQPLDHDSYVAYCLRGLDGVRFAKEVDDVSATYVGRWPHGRVHVRFRHIDYPGLTMVARLNLYDERGARLDKFLTYVRTELMEQAGAQAYPPASDAVDGALYI
ncbi:hypothetical protein BFN03_19640 [Rhodococcus sp. WMMA185]|uniref:hypothetical protein n=1 Tax=Rhodococcus sp. WMMA185 TaxID=679318 RepID=UPI000877FC65|nr:hypothetical protein [Rhodococcus sp. WMMA185]AOW94150.1 hypothetical protein BFN03_19640 [Rhodococcus sp. WMMA185]